MSRPPDMVKPTAPRRPSSGTFSRFGPAALFALAAMLVVSSAEAQVGISLSGRASSRIEGRVIDRLEGSGVSVTSVDSDDPAEIAEGHNGAITGRIRRRGGRWRATLTVYDAEGERVDTVRAAGRTDRALGNALARRLLPVLEGLGSTPAAAVAMEPKRVVVGSIVGPGSGRVRTQVVRALDRQDPIELVEMAEMQRAATRLGVELSDDAGLRSAAGALGVHAVVEGETRRRGRRWSANIEIVDAGSAEVVGEHRFVGRNAATLANSVRRELWDRLHPAFAQTEAPPAPERPAVSGASDDEDDRDEDDDSAPEPADADPSNRPVALDLAVEARVFSRRLRYHQDRFSLLRGYTLDFGPTIAATARWFPGAHFTDGFGAHIGIDVEYERAFGINTTRRDQEVFPTTMQSWAVGLRGRIPFGAQSFGVAIAYGGHEFSVDPSGPAVPGRNNIPLLPSVDYRFLRFTADGRLAPIAGLRLLAGFSYLLVLDAGGIQESIWFPRASVGAIAAHGGIGYELDVGIEVRAVVMLRRYFYTFDPEPLDPWIAGGAVDQYISYSLALAWRLK